MKTGRFKSETDLRLYREAYDEVLARLPPPARSLDIPTPFGGVHVHEWKKDNDSRPPVFLLPGRSAGSPMWEMNLPDFIAQRTVYAVDFLGDAGLSVQTRAFASADDIAVWIAAVLDALRLPKIHLTGHSFGGGNAAGFAVRRPERLASLALIDPAFALNSPPVSVLLYATAASLKFLPKKWRDGALARMTGDSTPGAGQEEDALARMIQIAASGFTASLPTPKPLTKPQLRGFSVPVYVALAGNSPITREAEAKAALLPEAVIKTWENATHSLPMEETAALDTALEAFWAANDIVNQLENDPRGKAS